jgi:hypothetical protein
VKRAGPSANCCSGQGSLAWVQELPPAFPGVNAFLKSAEVSEVLGVWAPPSTFQAGLCILRPGRYKSWSATQPLLIDGSKPSSASALNSLSSFEWEVGVLEASLRG